MPRIELDSTSKRPVREQLIEQLRYLIATGHYQVNDTLPSTRTLGDQLDISFHTVRKAYQELEEEGLLEAKVGSGYTVQERTPLAKSERIERGAKVVNETLQTLVGLGLSEAEIEALFQEQANLLDHSNLERKLVVVGPHPELNAMYAEQLRSALQQSVRPISLSQLERHQDADYAFAPYPFLSEVLRNLPRGDTLGFVTHVPSRVLERTARLLDREALGLVTRYRDTIPPLSEELRTDTAYGGQVIAASIEEGVEHLPNVIEQTDLLLYTPESKRRLLPFLGDNEDLDAVELEMIVSSDSIDAIGESVPA
ncbi:GntR family transcriptional regulator [Salinibacter sp. 10B]|uniref:GntR family transcriptional regulator n=1 Tax=Salinibacter sp. 10B TaxID=1923971 RepID=UPI000CF39345|nr:GntR family transcriptional regulator [Salinibacter sp. 10B]PQJ33490.1 GntR family transcriptional regulator [Salinibacter sp. 10B]